MVALVSTVHDPEGRMVATTNLFLPLVARLYEAIVVVTTPDTSPDLITSLREALVEPLPESAGAVGVGRRHALRLGLERGAQHLHYCDFDRLLHWIGAYPDELASTLQEIQHHDYLIIGRTERAFQTHPLVQVDTERVTNHAFSLWFGRPVDVAAGSCGMSGPAAELLLRASAAPTNATDAEWPAIVRVHGGDVGYLATEGLEFETPDYFADQIEEAGSLGAWLAERSRPLSAWIPRTRLALDSLEAAMAAIQAHQRDPRV